MLLIRGLIGMLGLCSFSWDFSVGGNGFFWFRCFIFCLSMIKLHCCRVLCMGFWYLMVGSFWNKWKLSVRNVCIFWSICWNLWLLLFCLCQLQWALHFLLQVYDSTFFIICNCLFCRVLWWLSELKICCSLLAAIMRCVL